MSAEPVAYRGRKTSFGRQVADWVFYLLLTVAVVLGGWLGARHDRVWDWTASGRNTLSALSATVLEGLNAPLRITVFLDRSHPLARSIEQLLARYRQVRADLEITYVDPQLFPEQARAAEVSLLGQMLLEYRGRRETLRELGEDALTAAIARLSRDEAPWVVVLEGHGERRIDGGAGMDLGRFGELLRAQGFRLQPLDLAIQPAIPDNSRLLVLSIPAIALFPGEARRLVEYLDGGGNLLWLMDPGDLGGLEPLAEHLGIERLPGKLVDANVRELNIEDPTVAMVARFPDHPLTRGLSAPALLPGSTAFLARSAPGWTPATPLETMEQSWNETGPVRGEVARDQELDERPGPLPVALALTRPGADGTGQQRVLIVGDGDFLSNAHLNHRGNLALGMRMVQWLTAPAGAGPVPPRDLPDRALQLTRTQTLIIGGGFLLVLPAVFLAVGLIVRWRRRRG